MDTHEKVIIAVIVGVVLSILIIIIVPFFWGFYNGYSDGERTGDVYKFSKKGLVWKSWEGEMYLGGVKNTQQGFELEKFYFSIPEKEEAEKQELISKIQECAKTRENCTIEYKQWFIAPVIQSSGYTVVGAK